MALTNKLQPVDTAGSDEGIGSHVGMSAEVANIAEKSGPTLKLRRHRAEAIAVDSNEPENIRRTHMSMKDEIPAYPSRFNSRSLDINLYPRIKKETGESINWWQATKVEII
ncbi:MAG: hypothetical protein WKF87_04285 [Chryseolinea sp.]